VNLITAKEITPNYGRPETGLQDLGVIRFAT